MKSPTFVTQLKHKPTQMEKRLQANEDAARAKFKISGNTITLLKDDEVIETNETPLVMPSTLSIQKTETSDTDPMQKVLVPQKEEEEETPLVMPKVEKK